MINNSINSSFFDIEFTGLNVFPIKSTTNSFDNNDMGSCISYGGLVSNLNCPKEIPFCNCNPKTFILAPQIKEPTDIELHKFLQETKECKKIYDAFKNGNKYLKFFGYDYSNPNSSYNCSCQEFFSETFGRETGYFFGKTAGFTWADGFGETYDNAGYFPYARRKTYTEGNTAYAFPPFTSPPKEPPTRNNTEISECSDQKIIGEFFPYYLEYSKTNATFWNTPVKTPLLRQAQSNLLFYQRISILVNGDFRLKPGDLVEINYPTPNLPKKENRFSGKWMIYRVVRNINYQKHTMTLYLMRDGPYYDPKEYSETLEKTKTGT